MKVTTFFCFALGLLCLLVAYGSVERRDSGSDWKPSATYHLSTAGFLALSAGLALIGAGATKVAKTRKRAG